MDWTQQVGWRARYSQMGAEARVLETWGSNCLPHQVSGSRAGLWPSKGITREPEPTGGALRRGGSGLYVMHLCSGPGTQRMVERAAGAGLGGKEGIPEIQKLALRLRQLGAESTEDSGHLGNLCFNGGPSSSSPACTYKLWTERKLSGGLQSRAEGAIRSPQKPASSCRMGITALGTLFAGAFSRSPTYSAHSEARGMQGSGPEDPVSQRASPGFTLCDG